MSITAIEQKLNLALLSDWKAYLSLYNRPDGARLKRDQPGISEEGDGLNVFKNLIAHLHAQ